MNHFRNNNLWIVLQEIQVVMEVKCEEHSTTYEVTGLPFNLTIHILLFKEVAEFQKEISNFQDIPTLAHAMTWLIPSHHSQSWSVLILQTGRTMNQASSTTVPLTAGNSTTELLWLAWLLTHGSLRTHGHHSGAKTGTWDWQKITCAMCVMMACS